MKSFRILIIIATLVSDAHAQFPVERTIVDIKGRKLEATVLSSSDGNISVRRNSDGKEFDIAVETLSVADRGWLKSVTEPKAPTPKKPVVDNPKPKPTENLVPTKRPQDSPPVKITKPISSKEILAKQEEQGLVPAPAGWDALETTIHFKDGKSITGYVYDVKEDTFWYGAQDMVQLKGSLSELATKSLLEIKRWRSRSPFAGSPSVALNHDGKQIHASIVDTNETHMTILTESGELMEQLPIEKLDADSRKFLDSWFAGTWEPKNTEWIISPKYTGLLPFYENGLTLARVDSKWGVIDRLGNFVDSRRFDEVIEIKDSSNLKIRENGKWGLMVEGAKLVVPTEWDDVGDMHNNMTPVQSGGKWGYVENGGELLIPCKWDDAWRFSSVGTAVVTLNGKRGFVDRSGNVIVKPEWDGALMHTPEGIGAVRRGNGWALIDTKGTLLCEPIWNFNWNDKRFQLGYIPAWPMRSEDKSKTGENFTFGYEQQQRQKEEQLRILNGKTLLGFDGKTDTKPRLRDGVCLAQQPGPYIGIYPNNMKFPLIDKAGNEIMFDQMLKSSGCLSAMRKGRQWGYADRNGLVIEPQWDQVGNFAQGLAPVLNWGPQGRSGSTSQWPWQFIDTSNKVIIENMNTKNLQFILDTSHTPWAPKFEQGYVEARDQKWKKFRISADSKIYPQNNSSVEWQLGKPFPKVEAQKKLGLMDLNGQIILKPEWERILTHNGPWIGILKNNKWGLADRTGRVLVEPFAKNQYFPVKLLDNGAAVIGHGTNQRVYFQAQTKPLDTSGINLLYFDSYGSKLVLRQGEGDATEWWVAQQESPNLWKLEGVGKIYWNKSLVEYDRIWLQDEATKLWHFCAIDGKRLGPEMTEKPSKWFLDGGMGIMRDGASCYFIDKDGQRLEKGIWEDARVFQNGYAAVKKNGLWGFIDLSGNIKIDCNYDEVGHFFAVSKDSEAKAPLLAGVSKAGLWGYINPHGKFVIPMEQTQRGSLQSGRICYFDPRNRWEVVKAYDAEGKLLEIDNRNKAEPKKSRADGWTVTVDKNDMKGLIHTSGKIGLNHEWRAIVWVAPNIVAVRKKDGGGLFSTETGWLFQETGNYRIIRDERGQLDPNFRDDGYIHIEEMPKWGFARYQK